MGTDSYMKSYFDDLFMRTTIGTGAIASEVKLKVPQSLGYYINHERIKVDLPEKYIINENATILFWKDGTKTIVKKCEEDEFNPRLAYLTAFFQHYCGMSKNKANKYLANLQYDGKVKQYKSVDALKVGDKVVVKKNLVVGKEYGTESFVNDMERLKGKEVTIKSIATGVEEYQIEEDGGEWFWTKEMFKKKIPKHMKEDK